MTADENKPRAEGELSGGFGAKGGQGGVEYGKITEAALLRLRERINVRRVTPREDWEIEDRRYTRGRVRQFAYAIGDYNPLYLDAEYAARSPYGTIIVPPGALVAIEQVNARSDGMPGLHALFRGLTLEWKRPLSVGDALLGETYLRDAYIRDSRFSGKAVIQEYESIGKNEKDEIIGHEWTSWHRAERMAAKSEGKVQKQRSIAHYSPDDLERMQADLRREFRRGAEKLFWEEVGVGEELAPVVKGPTNQAQRMIGEGGSASDGGGKIGGGSDWSVLHAQVWKLFEKHPGLPFFDEQGIPQVPVVIHNSNERCQRYLGLPGAYDAGWQRLHWTIHCLTNWMGDRGFLRKLSIRFPNVNLMGDTTWCRAKVKGKRQENNAHIVELEVWNENQLGVQVTQGEAEVLLPSRAQPDRIVWQG